MQWQSLASFTCIHKVHCWTVRFQTEQTISASLLPSQELTVQAFWELTLCGTEKSRTLKCDTNDKFNKVVRLRPDLTSLSINQSIPSLSIRFQLDPISFYLIWICFLYWNESFWSSRIQTYPEWRKFESPGKGDYDELDWRTVRSGCSLRMVWHFDYGLFNSPPFFAAVELHLNYTAITMPAFSIQKEYHQNLKKQAF